MQKWKILVVDDESEIITNLVNILSEQGYNVSTALNFNEGHFMIEHYHFDIAIIDLFLPDGNGIDLYRFVKTKNENIYTIVITGNATIENAITALNEGVNAYLIKPFTEKQLKASLRQAEKTLSLRAENQALFQEIQHNRQFYENLLDSTSEAIIVIDLEYRIQYCNNAARQFLLLENDHVKKQPIYLYIEDGYKVLSHIYQQLVQGKSVAGFRVNIIPSKGKSFDAHLSADILRNNNNHIEGFIINLTNPLINDEIFNRMLRKEKLSTIINLANILNHEIRNPVNILSGRIQLLTEEMENENINNALKTMERQIDRILEVTDLLSKFSLSREDSVPQHCNVTEILKDVLKEKKQQIKNEKIKIKVSLNGTQNKIVEGNRSQFTDAFRYLIDAIIELVPKNEDIEILCKVIKNYTSSPWQELQFVLPHVKVNIEQLFNSNQSIDIELNSLIILGMTIMFIIFNNYGAKIESFNKNGDQTIIRIQFPLISEKSSHSVNVS
jgi:PAS domain S-box-containing protein